MPRIVYVNGRYKRYREAGVHVEDRGFQLADGVYEVMEINAGRLIDETRHLERLERSLAQLAVQAPASRAVLSLVLRETVRRNRVADGLAYIQVTRGEAARDFLFPEPTVPPTLVVMARRLDQAKLAAMAASGVAVVTMPEMRWGRCDIKTVMLLPAVLAKEKARAAGAREAWFVDRDGYVTEGASSNAWIVDGEGRLVTRPLGPDILPGVTRRTVMDAACSLGIEVVERAFKVEEAKTAREAFNTAASATVMPVTKIDGEIIGNGRPGPVTCRLRDVFHSLAEGSRPAG